MAQFATGDGSLSHKLMPAKPVFKPNATGDGSLSQKLVLKKCDKGRFSVAKLTTSERI
jgi:hypothetical protein